MGAGRIGGTSMNPRNGQDAEREARSLQADKDELAERIAQLVPQDATIEPVNSGLRLSHYATPSKPLHGMLEPSLCVLAQGSKVVLLGKQWFRYDPAHFLLVSV